MSLVEKEITHRNVELARNRPELEKFTEVEHKLVPSNPELLEQLLKAEAWPVEQLYLSTPSDEFSLRVRCDYKPDGPIYTATQKSRGENIDNALARGEIETDITAEAFAQYQQVGYPSVFKLRAEVTKGVTVDFYDDEDTPVIVEIEHKDPAMRAYLLQVMQTMTDDTLQDRSNDTSLTNEAIAYRAYINSGKTERLRTPESLDAFTNRVLGEMVAHFATGKKHVIVGLSGMSGSGKTTVTNALKESVTELFGEEFTPIVLSTDDYHFGKEKLEATYGAPYTDWDDAKTYDTTSLARDLELLKDGSSFAKRHFDFDTEEPAIDGIVSPSPFIIIEGLYAGSNDLQSIRDLHFEIPTGIATSIGRDVRRLVIEDRANRAFPTPQSRLKYQIEVALPKYLEQQKPERKPFSASTRPLAERAFMLAKLAKI